MTSKRKKRIRENNFFLNNRTIYPSPPPCPPLSIPAYGVQLFLVVAEIKKIADKITAVHLLCLGVLTTPSPCIAAPPPCLSQNGTTPISSCYLSSPGGDLPPAYNRVDIFPSVAPKTLVQSVINVASVPSSPLSSFLVSSPKFCVSEAYYHRRPDNQSFPLHTRCVSNFSFIPYYLRHDIIAFSLIFSYMYPIFVSPFRLVIAVKPKDNFCISLTTKVRSHFLSFHPQAQITVSPLLVCAAL